MEGVNGRTEGWGVTVTAGQGEDEEEEEEDDDEEQRLASWKSLCNWSLTTWFMTLCISDNILSFSFFGMRPKRTAVDGGGGASDIITSHTANQVPDSGASLNVHIIRQKTSDWLKGGGSSESHENKQIENSLLPQSDRQTGR